MNMQPMDIHRLRLKTIEWQANSTVWTDSIRLTLNNGETSPIFGKEQELTQRYDFRDGADIKSVMMWHSSANDLRGFEFYDKDGSIIV